MPKLHIVKTVVPLSFFTLLTGCEQFHLFVEDDKATDTAEEELTPNPSIDLEWGETGIDIVITNGQGYEFEFGIAESSSECAIDTEYGCWTAEDCISGYQTPQDSFAHSPYCHSLSDIGGSLRYSDSLIGVITGTSPDYVIPGEQTAFPAPTSETTYEFSVTYYLKAVSTGSDPTIECWAWGLNPDHFSSEGCKAPIPIALPSAHPEDSVHLRTQRWSLPLNDH